jgi:transposase
VARPGTSDHEGIAVAGAAAETETVYLLEVNADRDYAAESTPGHGLRGRRAAKLTSWFECAMGSDFHGVAQFAKTLSHDTQAVELAIQTPWRNGPLESHINRLKAIKRQTYVRAGFHLLRARLLP